ncbi:hypothetical protein FRZ44_06200 [Hypericibacter terrae]|uniref:Uncharacterized protein n=1 Tax=Hypericibacter terrae TaxID=2602015 RepID=A0A5J6ME95_9PROT|nr:hypothetical protein FRZ44_06200 [Hypericibacter terrae]
MAGDARRHPPDAGKRLRNLRETAHAPGFAPPDPFEVARPIGSDPNSPATNPDRRRFRAAAPAGI